MGVQTAKELAHSAQRLYGEEAGLLARLQEFRPYICPFEELIELVPPGASVLDVGCGAGLFLGLLAQSRRIHQGLGFDSSSAAVTLGQRMTRHLPADVRIEIKYVDATGAWPARTFDVVSLIDVMHHVPPDAWSTVLANAARCVNVGGIVLYKDMAERPRWRATCNQLHDLVLARQWIHHVPDGVVEEAMRAAGFVEVARGAASRYWYAHVWQAFRRLN
ncbi:MAG: class I SAM-dependent methyltransferase [Steroidobacteraceae bacterium]